MPEVRFVHVYAEQDEYENGCIGNGWDNVYAVNIVAETQEQLLKEIAEHFGVDREEIEINACEEPGRIDVSRQETEDGSEPTTAQYEAWKQGLFKLFYVTYSMYAEDVTRKPATLV